MSILTYALEFKELMKERLECCAPKKTGADNKHLRARVNRIKGQIEGIGRMLEEQAYCPHIITQIQAARSALGSLQASILSAHLEQCVKNSLSHGSTKDMSVLIDELVGIFKQS